LGDLLERNGETMEDFTDDGESKTPETDDTLKTKYKVLDSVLALLKLGVLVGAGLLIWYFVVKPELSYCQVQTCANSGCQYEDHKYYNAGACTCANLIPNESCSDTATCNGANKKCYYITSGDFVSDAFDALDNLMGAMSSLLSKTLASLGAIIKYVVIGAAIFVAIFIISKLIQMFRK
jgi:hypothetical protein